MNKPIFQNLNHTQTKKIFQFYQIFNDDLIEKNIKLDYNLCCSFCNSKEKAFKTSAEKSYEGFIENTNIVFKLPEHNGICKKCLDVVLNNNDKILRISKKKKEEYEEYIFNVLIEFNIHNDDSNFKLINIDCLLNCRFCNTSKDVYSILAKNSYRGIYPKSKEIFLLPEENGGICKKCFNIVSYNGKLIKNVVDYIPLFNSDIETNRKKLKEYLIFNNELNLGSVSYGIKNCSFCNYYEDGNLYCTEARDNFQGIFKISKNIFNLSCKSEICHICYKIIVGNTKIVEKIKDELSKCNIKMKQILLTFSFLKNTKFYNKKVMPKVLEEIYFNKK